MFETLKPAPKINVLSLKNDTAVGTRLHAISDSYRRKLKYSELFNNLTVIYKTLKKANPIKPKNNLLLIPTNSKSKLFFFPDLILIINKLLKTCHFDVVTTQDPFQTGLAGLYLKKRFKIPLNVQLRFNAIDNPYFLKENFHNLIYNVIGKVVLQNADTLNVCTNAEKFYQTTYGIKKERIWVIPTLINTAKFLNSNMSSLYLRKSLLSKKFKKIILFTGRLEKQKDLMSLVKTGRAVINERRDVLFLVCGTGSQKKVLLKLIQRYNLKYNFKYMGAIYHDLLVHYYKASDVVFLPTFYEGASKTLIEAALSEKPAVSTFCLGNDEVILNGKTGFLTNIGDIYDMKEKLLFLLDNPDVARNMARHAKLHAISKYNEEKILFLYKKCLEVTANNIF